MQKMSFVSKNIISPEWYGSWQVPAKIREPDSKYDRLKAPPSLSIL